MKKFLKRRWHRIPVAAMIAVLVLTLATGGVLALPSVDQTITQDISDYEYGTITADAIELPDIKVDSSATWPSTPEQWDDSLGAVIVVVGPDGVGKWLHLTLDATTTELYDACMVSLFSPAAQNPMGTVISLQVRVGFPLPDFPDILEASIQLTGPGTYTFNEGVQVTAGSTPGTANVKVGITLEDTS